jgi:hypothetical protein
MGHGRSYNGANSRFDWFSDYRNDHRALEEVENLPTGPSALLQRSMKAQRLRACSAPLRARLPLSRLDSFVGGRASPLHKAAFAKGVGDIHNTVH